MGDWKFSFDYLNNTYGKSGATVSGSATDLGKTSMVLMVDYNMGNWIPQFKYETSTVNNVTAAGTYAGTGDTTSALAGNTTISATANNSLTIAQLSIGTEYKPNTADKYRWHLMMNQKTTTFGSGITATSGSLNSPVENRVYAGIRWQADVLK